MSEDLQLGFGAPKSFILDLSRELRKNKHNQICLPRHCYPVSSFGHVRCVKKGSQTCRFYTVSKPTRKRLVLNC